MAQALATRFAQTEVSFTRRASDTSQLFGSVTSADIAEALAAQGFEVDRRKIQLADPIKAVGEYAVPVRLHREVTAQGQGASSPPKARPRPRRAGLGSARSDAPQAAACGDVPDRLAEARRTAREQAFLRHEPVACQAGDGLFVVAAAL